MVGDVRRQVRQQDRVLLETTLRGEVMLLGHSHGMADDAISDLEASDAFSDFDDFSGDIASQHGWIFDPVVKKIAETLFDVVERVDGYGVILNHNLRGAWLRVWCMLDFERVGFGAGEVCRLV